MSYLERNAPQRSLEHVFGFKFQKCEDGWRWTTFDTLGDPAENGVAKTKAEAAACVIRALART